MILPNKIMTASCATRIKSQPMHMAAPAMILFHRRPHMSMNIPAKKVPAGPARA
jgi:hypothetical protein